jgi:hypothetical protein
MKKRLQRVVRQGRMYHVTVAGTDHALFVWGAGKQFCGRVEGQPQVPEQTAATAAKVCDALSALLAAPQR